MQYTEYDFTNINVKAAVSKFCPDQDGMAEYSIILRGTNPLIPFKQQAENIEQAMHAVAEAIGSNVKPVFLRYFLSDPTNQAEMLQKPACATSVIGQAPLDGTKIAAWAYMLSDVKPTRRHSGLWGVSHGNYTHFWCGGVAAPDLRSELATLALFGDYQIQLSHEGCQLLDNCMRTWFFVRDIDVNYRGMVSGRNDVFRHSGLSPHTHFIASTGIGGSNADTTVSVTMDAYAVKGLQPEQVRYLHASDFLNSTIEYGVAFERGTAIDYGDRRHVIISGTASINNSGKVMHPGDIIAQTQRMTQNVEALLSEGGAGWNDVTHIILYLRDSADYEAVRHYAQLHFGDIPLVIVQGAVCRPGWLVEMECNAIIPQSKPEFPEF